MPTAVATAQPLARPPLTNLRDSSLRLPRLRVPSVRRRWPLVLGVAVVLVDQATKAVPPTGAFIVNTGAFAALPSAFSDELWESPTLGAACDTLDAVLLLVALRLSFGLANTSHRAAATAIIAGLLSNLADRLGTTSLFHAGQPRGSVDWIPVPMWSPVQANLADVVIVVGAFGIACQPVRRAARALLTLARRSSATHLARATAGILAIAIWATFWQANRQGVDLEAAPRPETTACRPAPPGEGTGRLLYSAPLPAPVTHWRSNGPVSRCARGSSTSPLKGR